MFWNFELNYKAALRDYMDMLQHRREISWCFGENQDIDFVFKLRNDEHLTLKTK